MSENPDQQREAQIHAEIAALGPCLPGTISERWLRCGNPRCRCRDPNSDRRHGPNLYWTRKVSANTASKLLSPEQADRYRPWLPERQAPTHPRARTRNARDPSRSGRRGVGREMTPEKCGTRVQRHETTAMPIGHP
ncbi:MAG: DUF6788 family protein [Solirubrobacteraceae bacterium]